MNTLEVEKDQDPGPATDAVELTDCGRASERTCGVSWMLLFELATPPNNRLFLF
jgi:hypothetical protein